MVKDARFTYTRNHTFRTRSNRLAPVKTPGGKIVGHLLEKKAQRPKCGDCKRALPGIPALRPYQYKTLAKRERTVSRAYGGSRCHKCVRTRIVRAFLEEEKKKVKALLAQGKKE
ncbi:hypothetical protein BASA81_007922 [Batrachochytrium salamandrivorans]|nr:hypothetical protein BASA81_007922 [Batrachochytrium salamandrivorans]